MKRKIALLFIAFSGLYIAQAQHLQEGEPALVYYSPKTSIVLDFSYTEEVHETGPYAQYAYKLLGIKEIETGNKTLFHLNDISIRSHTDVDLTRPHKVVATSESMQLLSINERGLLVGYNLPPYEKKAKHNHEDKDPIAMAGTSRAASIPEEVLKTSALSDQAEIVAKQIYHIREARMYLLSGEVEHAPADGEAMKLVLDEMARQEEELTALFVGRSRKTEKHKQIEIYPNAGELEHEEMLYFSSENGFTAADNIDAKPILIHADFTRPVVESSNTDKKKSKEMPIASQIVYNMPGRAEVRVDYEGKQLAAKMISVAQLGVDVPLPQALFTGDKLPVIVISEKTGNILSISK